ncbi:NlpC/P60 family protein [Paracoccaceae bacterium GXU_MW_L88]
MSFDARLMPARPEVAAEHLRGEVEAARFDPGRAMRVAVPVLDLTRHPDPDGPLETQLLLGEGFTVYDIDRKQQLGWGQSATDDYVGWVPLACLDEPEVATHKVTALATHVYEEPSMKTRPIAALPFMAELVVIGEEGDFYAAKAGGFIPRQHLAPVTQMAADFVAECGRLLGVPYLWGGRSPWGIDCSALIQTGLRACGKAALRDTDMQEATLGTALPEDAPLERGDLIFWKGHIGVMEDAETLLHANAHHMAVAREPLAEAVSRIEARGDGPITSRRRLS